MQKTDELIEAVARAIAIPFCGGTTAETFEQCGDCQCWARARAALQAIEESGCEIRPKVTRRREPSIGYLTKGG
jgi:hypothetical protein